MREKLERTAKPSALAALGAEFTESPISPPRRETAIRETEFPHIMERPTLRCADCLEVIVIMSGDNRPFCWKCLNYVQEAA